MEKTLNYFSFTPAKYLAGDIQNCTLEAQGLFMNIVSIYWSRGLELNLKSIRKKYRYLDIDTLLNDLDEEGVIKIDSDENVTINFLNEYYEALTNLKKARSEAGKKSGAARRAKAAEKQQVTQTKETNHEQNLNKTETKTNYERRKEGKKERKKEGKEEGTRELNSPPPPFSEVLEIAKSVNPRVNQKELKRRFENWRKAGWRNSHGEYIPDFLESHVQKTVSFIQSNQNKDPVPNQPWI